MPSPPGPNPMMIPSTRSWCSSAWNVNPTFSPPTFGKARHGQVLQAQLHALRCASSPRMNAAQKEELFAIVAVCLSQQHYLPQQFTNHTGSRAAVQTRRRFTIGQGARELLALHQGNRLEPSAYPWWPAA